MRPVGLWLNVLVVTAAVATGGSAGAADAGLEWTQIPDDEANIVFYAPGLNGGIKRFFRSRDPREWHVQEVARWVGPSGRYPYAQIVLVQLGPRYHFNRRSDVKRDVRDMLIGEDVKFEDNGRLRNVLGKVYYTTYHVDSDKCLGFSQYFGTNFDYQGTWSEGNSKLFGYYCVGADRVLSAEDVALVLKGIGVKGERVPERPAFGAPLAADFGGIAIIDCLLPSRAMTSRHSGDFTRESGVISTTAERCVFEGGEVLTPDQGKGPK